MQRRALNNVQHIYAVFYFSKKEWAVEISRQQNVLHSARGLTATFKIVYSHLDQCGKGVTPHQLLSEHCVYENIVHIYASCIIKMK